MPMEDLLTRQAPHSQEAEQSVLGSMLIDSRCISDVVGVVRPEDFYLQANREIYETMYEMFSYSEVIDPVTVLDKMRARGVYNEESSTKYLMQLMEITPTAANVKRYAQIVHDKALLRNLSEAASGIVETVYEGVGSAQEILEAAEKRIYALRRGNTNESLEHIGTVLLKVFDRLKELSESGSDISGLSTGLRDLDKFINGLNRSDLVLLAARPGMGKTSMALNVALNVAKKNPQKTVAFFSLEMSKEQLVTRLISNESFVDNKKLVTVQPESRKNEMVNNFLKPGLQDLCVSRTSFKWGIPVDFDPAHVIYVWIDALSNYVTGTGFDLDGNHTLVDGENLYEKYWPADLHLIGKDILRFHTIYWPIMLMALDLPLPKQVFGHPWLLQGDGKMSKSKGNVIYADDLVDIFGVDAVRYFVLHEMPFENDGVVSWELMVERMNSDLANVLGNLVNRTISMTNKYLGGVLENKNVTEAVDDDLKETVLSVPKAVEEKMDKLRVADAITEVFRLFKRCNKYIDETEPWVLGKDEAKKDRLSTVLYNLVESIVIGASLLEPFMPETTEKILAQLNAKKRGYEEMDTFGQYESGTKVTDSPEILFMRLDPKEVLAKAEEIKQKQMAEAKAESGEEDAGEEEGIDIEAKPEITFDDFMKMQFQVGEIIACEEVPKSKKLLCSQVKIGSEVKQIVSGIKKYYSPEEMVGKKVMVLVNLKPAKLAGVLSEGMLLCAEDAEGNLSLMTPEKKMPAGAEIC